MTAAAISATSVICAAGFGAPQVWATVRSRVSRVSKSSVVDRDFEPIAIGLVPETALDPDDSDLDSLGWPSGARRMLRLSAPALRELGPSIGDVPVTLYLGLPELTAEDSPWIDEFSKQICARAGVPLDEGSSHTFPLGRASTLVALERALAALSIDPSHAILVGGVDTFLDLRLLALLGAENRILTPRTMDGFVPGEGAAFLLLKSAGESDSDRVLICSAASITDPGHRYGTEPASGEGLAHAMERLRGSLPSPIRLLGSVFAGLNGENFDAKLWGIARLRHNDLFAPNMMFEHPASCFGDAGAATGTILMVLAAAALSAHHRQGPALIWAASDRGSHGCAVLSSPSLERQLRC